MSRCRIDLIAVKIFVDKIQSHYRNGLDGGKDMRSFSSLYLYMRLEHLRLKQELRPFTLIIMHHILLDLLYSSFDGIY